MIEHWENLDLLREPLLDWYDAHRRILPWREEPSPYRTWVSEIMLQQTRVTAVIPYFTRFMAELPDVRALAAVSEERLFKLWEGLGYYSRARNLHRAAERIVSDFGGTLPTTLAELRTLPGVGDYTASAIASIHFGAAEPAVDGNLLRVAARVACCGDDITDAKVRKRFRDRMSNAIDRDQPGKWNQAMMDLGATVCLPNGSPLCGDCPARGFCAAYRERLTEVLPVRAEKRARRAEERTVFLLLSHGKIAVRQRPEKGLLAKLMEFPNVSGNLDESAARLILAQWGLAPTSLAVCGTAKHVFTHIEWQMKGWRAEVSGCCDALRWVDRAELDALAIPTAFQVFTAKAQNLLDDARSNSGDK
ncbi:MAG: A/G-specific adenine glycosylase [Oscillospiraceae bacterium]|nr:A/G-specific adenine glycosylase [Oscillospiraceae bacterium]